MTVNHLWLCLFSITACFVVGIVARVAILEGDIAGVNQFPYQVALLYNGENGCGAGIIGDQFLLSAAHCVLGPDNHLVNKHITALIGTNSLNDIGKQHVMHGEVIKVYVPTEFNGENDISAGDIAVLKLKARLRLTKHKHWKPLQLPKDKHETYVGETACIAGFGWDWIDVCGDDEENGGKSDPYLRYIEANVLNRSQIFYNAYAFHEKQFCARVKHLHHHSNPRGVCNGDSGGPLVHGGITVIGILSLSPIGCSEKEDSAVYTSVSHYLDFINNAIYDKHHAGIRAYEVHHPQSGCIE